MKSDHGVMLLHDKRNTFCLTLLLPDMGHRSPQTFPYFETLFLLYRSNSYPLPLNSPKEFTRFFEHNEDAIIMRVGIWGAVCHCLAYL